MARQHTIEASATSAADADTVWALLADTSCWTDWAGCDAARRTRDGVPDAEGVGARRLFLRGRTRNEEEIERFEPGRVLGYTVIGGNIPVRDYHSEVTLTPADGGATRITWRSTFRGRWPGSGGLVAGRLGPFLQETVNKLAAAAEARPS